MAGAGMVGAAIAYGLAGLGQRVLLIDGADTDYRAAKANFGLVWLQGKGLNHPHYQRLSYRSVRQWPAFARELQEESGVDLHYERRGGLHFCLGEAELEARAARMQAWLRQAPEVGECVSILPRDALLRRYPGLALGPEVSGASVGELDGHANPLRLLAALQSGFQRRGGQLWGNSPVHGIRALSGGGFEVEAGTRRARCTSGHCRRTGVDPPGPDGGLGCAPAAAARPDSRDRALGADPARAGKRHPPDRRRHGHGRADAGGGRF
ncbi:FAD dependent oxidoreductase family protein [Bordetella holmesii 70147]|nr:FAD dependent oxidoreductase family protein [Bordetella holmesii 70147]